MADNLDTYIKENRKFLKLKSGERFVGFFRGCIVAADPFNKDLQNPKQIMVYRLQEEDSDTVLNWSCKQVRVAEDFKKIEIGSKIKLERKGETANDTRYSVTVL